MELNASGFRRQDGAEIRVRAVDERRYVVDNAYEGSYEYFPNRPLDPFGTDSRDGASISEKTGNHSRYFDE